VPNFLLSPLNSQKYSIQLRSKSLIENADSGRVFNFWSEIGERTIVGLSFFAPYVLFPSIVRVFLQVLGLESDTSMLGIIFFPSTHGV